MRSESDCKEPCVTIQFAFSYSQTGRPILFPICYVRSVRGCNSSMKGLGDTCRIAAWESERQKSDGDYAGVAPDESLPSSIGVRYAAVSARRTAAGWFLITSI